jgi:putative ABC transport system permease protein
MVLAVAGGGLALLLAPWGLSALLALAPAEMPRLDEIRLDGTVMAFALAASLVAGLLAGLAPALQLTSPRLMDVLREGSGGTAARGKARAALVTAEIALAFMLAAGAGLMIRTVAGLLDVPSGLAAPERVLIADLDLPQARYPGTRVAAFAQDLLQRLAANPAVRNAALATSVPLDPRGSHEFGFELQGGDPFPPGQAPKAEIVFASPGYTGSLGVPLVRGRDLRWSDGEKAPHVALVNESFVRRYLPGEPLGRRIDHLVGPGDVAWEIVGVIGDVHTRGLDLAPGPLIVVPLLQFPVEQLRLAARAASGDPLQLVPVLRSELAALDKDLPLAAPQPLARVVSESVGERRFQATLLTVFALLSLALAALGIYGVTAWTVAQRSREIGIRMALGADSAQVLRMVLGGGLRLALAGVGLGLLGALAGTRLLASLVYRVSTADPLTLISAAGVLVCAAALASWLPAWRATRVDPSVSLRAD